MFQLKFRVVVAFLVQVVHLKLKTNNFTIDLAFPNSLLGLNIWNKPLAAKAFYEFYVHSEVYTQCTAVFYHFHRRLKFPFHAHRRPRNYQKPSQSLSCSLPFKSRS
jgi:hypothetical protein